MVYTQLMYTSAMWHAASLWAIAMQLTEYTENTVLNLMMRVAIYNDGIECQNTSNQTFMNHNYIYYAILFAGNYIQSMQVFKCSDS